MQNTSAVKATKILLSVGEPTLIANFFETIAGQPLPTLHNTNECRSDSTLQPSPLFFDVDSAAFDRLKP
jgi:hypothetical protein